MTLYSDGRYNVAEELEVQVMETRKRVLGDKHPDTLSSMSNFAHALWSHSCYEDAVALLEACTQSRQQVLDILIHNCRLRR
jgi:hypothetical protein